MALSQANSGVNGDNACNGILRVCLQHDNGAPFFDQFDIGGGPATGASPYTNTGLQSGSSSGQQSNYGQESHNGGTSQCFDYDYTPASGTTTSDVLVIQPTDASNNPIGNAIVLDISHAACSGGGNCDGCENSIIEWEMGSGADLEIRYQDVGMADCVGCSTSFSYPGGPPPIGFQTNTGFIATFIASQLESAGAGDYTGYQVTSICDGVTEDCDVTIRITDPDNNDGCIDTSDTDVEVQDTSGNALPINVPPGTTVQFLTNVNINSGGLAGYFLTVKDPSGNYSGNPSFVSSSTDGQVWQWTVPSDGTCQSGLYRLCINPPQGSACPTWEPVDGRFSVNCATTSPCDGFSNNPITMNCGETVTLSIFIDEEDGSPSTSTPSLTVIGNGASIVPNSLTSLGNGNWEFDLQAVDCPGSASNELIRVNWLRAGATPINCSWPYSVVNPSCNENITAAISGTTFQAGDSATLSAVGCQGCLGYTLEWYLFSGGPYDGSSGGYTIQDPDAYSTQVNFTKDGEYEFRIRCCPPAGA